MYIINKYKFKNIHNKNKVYCYIKNYDWFQITSVIWLAKPLRMEHIFP